MLDLVDRSDEVVEWHDLPELSKLVLVYRVPKEQRDACPRCEEYRKRIVANVTVGHEIAEGELVNAGCVERVSSDRPAKGAWKMFARRQSSLCSVSSDEPHDARETCGFSEDSRGICRVAASGDEVSTTLASECLAERHQSAGLCVVATTRASNFDCVRRRS